MSRVIFLDFDGVITTPKSKFKLITEKMQLIKKLCLKTNSSIVITSDWRFVDVFHTLESLNKNSEFILNDFVSGVTKHLKIYDDQFIKFAHRGDEIELYLEEHPEITNYVIIDDCNDFLASQLNNLVITNSNYGINSSDIFIAFRILIK